jgi:hypothetical protein
VVGAPLVQGSAGEEMPVTRDDDNDNDNDDDDGSNYNKNYTATSFDSQRTIIRQFIQKQVQHISSTSSCTVLELYPSESKPVALQRAFHGTELYLTDVLYLCFGANTVTIKG